MSGQAKTAPPTWRSVYPGEWTYDGLSYVWADSLKGGQTTPLQVRGWGYLTGGGHGALGLDEDTARRIQDDLGRLMAAAPALLDAAQRLIEVNDRITDAVMAAADEAEVQRISKRGSVEFTATLEPLRAAIAKASAEPSA